MSFYPQSAPGSPAYATSKRDPHEWNGYAVAAFAVAFLPSPITLVLTYVFAIQALNRIKRFGARGKRLAIAAMIISPVIVLSSILIFTSVAATFNHRVNAAQNTQATPAPTAANSVSSQARADAISELNEDMVATRSQMAETLRIYPNKYPIYSTDIPVIKREGEVIKVTYVTNNTWFVTGYTTVFGNPDRDYIDYLSWDGVGTGNDRFHGAYADYLDYAQAHCSCQQSSTGDTGATQ